MHLQQRNSVITTQSQQASSHCDCKRGRRKKRISTKQNYRFPFWVRKCHRNWHSLWQQTRQRMRSSVHMPAATIGILNSGGNVCTTTVLSACVVCLFAFACVCQQHLSHRSHSSDSTDCPCFSNLEMKPEEFCRCHDGCCAFCFCFDSFLFFSFRHWRYFFCFAQLQLRLQFRQGLFSFSLFPSPMRSPISKCKNKQQMRQQEVWNKSLI